MNPKNNLNKRSTEEVVKLYKMLLMMVEDMKQDHDFHYAKLYQHIPKEYNEVIDTANHFTSEKMAWIRKRILDYGNSSIRNLQEELENYQISFIFK